MENSQRLTGERLVVGIIDHSALGYNRGMSGAITVLIADDHGVVREGLRAMLEREGFQVVAEAATGREAIEQATATKPQVMLLDIRMPDLDGLQALSAM